ncbi:hypothetical protein C8F04DRAFT_51593 [Mycena alexandri]|uniref:F-box domain-containing protein n=1 Tax=Mycena alexandri TaxID=1745969 RepID=A0AAD6WXU4_9AGAR|nr:hypothetical protein C8F04DRAFT_51593 [Mycena alexandri]
MNDHVPIFSLPTELLIAIIAAAQDFQAFPSQLDGWKPEWTMSRVSRRFRDVSLAASSLWRLVQVDLISEHSVEIFKLYLARSQGCEIWVNLRELSWVGETIEHPSIAERLSHIVPHIGRVQRLGILSNPESMNAMLEPFRDAEVPYLEYLQLHSTCYSCPVELFLSGAPKLAFFTLSGFTHHFPIPQWAASLTHLELRGCEDVMDAGGNSFFAAITTHCPSLVHLYIGTTAILYGPHNISAGQIHIPTLKTLHICVSYGRNSEALLEHVAFFDTPAVTDLAVDYAHGDDISVLFGPTILPRPVFPAVTSLSFASRGCTCGLEIEIRRNRRRIPAPPLHLFPAVTSLTLVNECFMANIVEDLIGPDSQPWPLLQTVTLCPTHKDIQEVNAVIQNVVRTRRQNGEVVPKFRLSPKLCEVGEDYWVENGVDVDIFDPIELVRALG